MSWTNSLECVVLEQQRTQPRKNRAFLLHKDNCLNATNKFIKYFLKILCTYF